VGSWPFPCSPAPQSPRTRPRRHRPPLEHEIELNLVNLPTTRLIGRHKGFTNFFGTTPGQIARGGTDAMYLGFNITRKF
jgi:hypothetical protein